MTDATVAQLEAVVAVVDYGSFTAAADVLRISQPSLSRRIRALEATLGVRLFVPAGRGMALTDMGRSLLAPARRALREMSSIEALIASGRALTSGSLRVAGLPSLVSTVAPQYVGRFHCRYPAVRIEVVGVDDAAELLEAVRLARADVAFGVVDRIPDDLSFSPLRDQRFLAVLPAGPADGAAGRLPADRTPDHAEPGRAASTDPDRAASADEVPGGEVLDAETLARQSLVTLPRGTSIREITDRVYRDYGVQPARVVTTTQRDALVPLSVAGAGLTIVPDALASQAVALGGRVARFRMPAGRPIGVVYRRDRHRTPAVESFLALVDPVDR